MSQGRRTDYGAQVRQYRQQLGLSVPQLAERAGLHANAIRKIEGGDTRVPQRVTRMKLARALELTDQQLEQLEARAGGAAHGEDGNAGNHPFIGRENDLAVLQRHLSGEGPPLVLLCGEPGIGKTALLEQLAALGVKRSMRVLQADATRGGRNPYSPVAEALQGQLQRPTDRLRRDLQGCDWLTLLLPELSEPPLCLPRRYASGQEQRLVVAAIEQFLTNIAGRHGTLLLLDDLQWAGEDGIQLIGMLARSRGQTPIRLVGAYRESEVPQDHPLTQMIADLASTGKVRSFPLHPLSEEEAGQLLDAVAGERGEINPSWRRQIVRQSGGVPFFLVSWGLSLESGEASSGASVPWNLAQSIRQRVAALSLPAQHVLHVVSLASELHDVIIAELFDGTGTEMVEAIEEACRAQLLTEGGEHAYRAQHDVIREVVERGLSAVRRDALHLRIAHALERHARQVGEGIEARLAWHLLQADALEEALPHLLAAGDRAAEMAAHREAELHYREASRVAQGVGDRRSEAAALYGLGHVLSVMVRYKEAIGVLEGGAQLYGDLGDIASQALAVARLARVYIFDGQPLLGLQRITSILPSLDQEEYPAALARLYAAQAGCLHAVTQFSAELAAAESASLFARRAGNEELLGETEAWRGLALFDLGGKGESIQVLERVIPVLERAGDLDVLTIALRELGWMYVELGRFEEALDRRLRALEAARRLGDPAREAVELAELAMLHIPEGRWKESRARLEEGIAIMRAIGTPPSASYPLLISGILGLMEGNWERALRELDEYMAVAQRTGDLAAVGQAQWALAEYDMFVSQPERSLQRFEAFAAAHGEASEALRVPIVLRVVAALLVQARRLDEAEPLIKEVIELSWQRDELLSGSEALRVYGQLEAARGHRERARELFEQSRDLARDKHYPYGEARAIYELGVLYSLMGDTHGAREHFDDALARFNELGAVKDAERTMDRLGPV